MKNNKKMTMMVLGLLGLSILSQKLISSGKRTEELASGFGETLKGRRDRLERERQALGGGFVPKGNTKKLAEEFEERADESMASGGPSLEELRRVAEERRRQKVLKGVDFSVEKPSRILREEKQVKDYLDQALREDDRALEVFHSKLQYLPDYIETHNNDFDKMRNQENLEKYFLKDYMATRLARNILDLFSPETSMQDKTDMLRQYFFRTLYDKKRS